MILLDNLRDYLNEDVISFPLLFQTGNIFVFTGMLKTCSNDDQLGIVLGHEIAHTVLSHGVSKI